MDHQSKGKPVTTSVPSISIRFHANAEQLEELYGSDEEQTSTNDSSAASTGGQSSSTGLSEPDSSPLKYLPRLVKRSTSIDITPTTNLDASPPSDPWRFFSDIKGKITKSVEEKITEIKSRNHDETGSPFKTAKVKDSKDNSSLSDSEELSESSISKTCGVISTTEGVEMSSEDETPAIEKDRRTDSLKFRILKQKSSGKEGTISKHALEKLYNINADKIEQALPEEEIESAVDALEDCNLRTSSDHVLKELEERYDNINVDENNVVNIREVSGNELREVHWSPSLDDQGKPKSVYSPVGFVDTRTSSRRRYYTVWPFFLVAGLSVAYASLYSYSSYLAGIIVGASVTYLAFYIKSFLETPADPELSQRPSSTLLEQEILEIPAAPEFQPVLKYEGWVNEYPEMYDPHTYHISQTQSVFLRLQGNLLRISHTRAKVPKRALWNEPKIKPVFTQHRVYNLLGAKIKLLPDGLAKKRHWSKKYPICILLNKDQMEFETTASTSGSVKTEDEEEEKQIKMLVKKQGFTFGKKKKHHVPAQRFSKLTEENEEYDLDSEQSRASTPSPDASITQEDPIGPDEDTQERLNEALEEANREDDHQEVLFDDEFDTLPDDWGTFTSPEDSPTETQVFLFGRTDREKEDWFRRLTAATHHGASAFHNDSIVMPAEESVSDTLIRRAMTEADYHKFMSIFNNLSGIGNPPPEEPVAPKEKEKKKSTSKKTEPPSNDDTSASNVTPPLNTNPIQWVNILVGRILFDCLRDGNFTERVRDKIQRKLSSIKLPYFIEELLVTQLSLGNNPPLIHRATNPWYDERGLWIDLDITYEGMVVLLLQTKLNLMKLKQPRPNGKLVLFQCDNIENCRPRISQRCFCPVCSRNPGRHAMYHSDVEDSAESSTDDEAGMCIPNNAALDSSGLPLQGLGGTSNTSKKIMKMVDKIAESKFFQAATEYRYVKRAMQGVSNTDLRLRVEVQELAGTLVLNIPPPPSDRIWIGFRPLPYLVLSAQPIVGEKNITFLKITSWIEKKMLQEFQKLLVIPNMEDLTIPVMSQKLPQ